MVADFRKKQKYNSSRQFLLLVGALALGLCLFLLASDSIRLHKKRVALAMQIENLKNKAEDIQAKNEAIQEAIAREHDDAYIERVAREELGLQKPEEKVFSFIVPQGQNVSSQSDSSDSPSKLPNWLDAMWGWVKQVF